MEQVEKNTWQQFSFSYLKDRVNRKEKKMFKVSEIQVLENYFIPSKTYEERTHYCNIETSQNYRQV